ncbi:MAG: hypothetical protein Q8P67_23930, partial [archaeon]|nr:hypothetical protein [archaeon]
MLLSSRMNVMPPAALGFVPPTSEAEKLTDEGALPPLPRIAPPLDMGGLPPRPRDLSSSACLSDAEIDRSPDESAAPGAPALGSKRAVGTLGSNLGTLGSNLTPLPLLLLFPGPPPPRFPSLGFRAAIC